MKKEKKVKERKEKLQLDKNGLESKMKINDEEK